MGFVINYPKPPPRNNTKTTRQKEPNIIILKIETNDEYASIKWHQTTFYICA